MMYGGKHVTLGSSKRFSVTMLEFSKTEGTGTHRQKFCISWHALHHPNLF